jgi:hypothetical protein
MLSHPLKNYLQLHFLAQSQVLHLVFVTVVERTVLQQPSIISLVVETEPSATVCLTTTYPLRPNNPRRRIRQSLQLSHDSPATTMLCGSAGVGASPAKAETANADKISATKILIFPPEI